LSSDTFPESAQEITQRESKLLILAFSVLSLTAMTLAIAPAARVGTWRIAPVPLQHFIVLPTWLLGVFLVRKSLHDLAPHRDPLLLPIVFLLAGWGMLILWRVAPTFGARQTGWFLVATLGLLIVLRAPSDLKWLRQYRYLWLIGGVALTALTLIFGTNPSGGEPRLWLGCCGFYFQPSEPLRLLLVAFLASYFADRLAFKWVETQTSWFLDLSPLVIVWSLSILLLFVQRDLGTGTLFLALLAILLFITTNRWQILLFAVGFIVLGASIGYAFIDVVQIRLDAWINPWADPIGGSYQLVQSLISVASGGILGRGPGLGTPGFVPAAHTDFIFTALTEEWGLVGAIALLALFAIFVSRGIKIALHLHDSFNKMLASGLILAIGLQAILIIGGVIRLLPLTGVTLPFVSYGGSSLLTSFLALGFLLHLSNKTTLEPNDLGALKKLQIGSILILFGLALTVGWWGVIRSETLISRTDNPRRAYVERFERRGKIVDIHHIVLSESVGQVGDYQRIYVSPSSSVVIGYNSSLYGLTGIEESMDPFLRGEAGYDAFETYWTNLLQGHPPPGLDIRLTLDSQIQKIAFDALRNKIGAVVLFEPASGDILAMVSTPSFNSNSIEADWESLITRTDAPLLNRATQSYYQPGMTLAPFLVAWGLENNFFQLGDLLPHGSSPVNLGGITVECSVPPPDSEEMNIAFALRSGCPQFFSDLGEEINAEELYEIFAMFKLDQSPSIRLTIPEPEPFTLPSNTEEIKLNTLGQSELTLTPLQFARAFGALVGEGILPPLRLVDAIRNPEGHWERLPPSDSPGVAVSPRVAQDVLSTAIQHGDGIRGFSFQAIVGTENDRLNWFLGSDLNGHAIVVILEKDTQEAAQNIGIALLKLAESSKN
jgi:cell division protein FtsW (lipid II flippase)